MNGIENNQASSSQNQTSQEENLFQDNSDLHQGGDTQSTDSDKPGDMNREENNQEPSQASTSQDPTSQEENLFHESSDLHQGDDTQTTDSDKPGDMNGEENNQESSQASTSQEENLFQKNSDDLCQETCTESAGSEMSESSHLTRMSTEEVEVLPESLGDPEEQNDRVKEPWEEEREFCLQSMALLSHEIHDLKLEIKRTSKTPRSNLSPFGRMKGRKALRENLEVEEKCHELNTLMKLNIELKADLEKQVQHLEKLQSNHQRLQAQESEMIMLAQAEEPARSSRWRNFILSFESEWASDACASEVWVWKSQWSSVSGCLIHVGLTGSPEWSDSVLWVFVWFSPGCSGSPIGIRLLKKINYFKAKKGKRMELQWFIKLVPFAIIQKFQPKLTSGFVS